MKIGLIGKDNYKGLGTLTEEWMRHMPLDKVMCVGDALKRWSGAIYVRQPTIIDYDNFTRGLDVVVVLEMAFPEIITAARKNGAKVALKVNYEYLPERLSVEPDLYLCSSSVNYDAVRSNNKVLIADPVDTDRIPFKKRKIAKVFQHNTGNPLNDANCTAETIEAFKVLKKEEFIIKQHGDVENYWELYGDGDVFVLPQKFRATSLPIQEAMASGMPVITTDIRPFNEFVPKETLIDPVGFKNLTGYYRPIRAAEIKIEDLRDKIISLLGKDIQKLSERSREYAESISWRKLIPKLKKVLWKI